MPPDWEPVYRQKCKELEAEIERLRSDARAYANIMLSEENDALIEENKRLRAVIVRSKDALLDGQSTQWVHDLLAGALHKEEHRGGMPFGGQSL